MSSVDFTPAGIDKWGSPNCLIAKYLKTLTPAEIEKLQTVKLLNGYDLEAMTRAAREIVGQHVGFYVGDPQCYDDFSLLIDKCIQEYHGVADIKQNKQVPLKDEGKIEFGKVHPDAKVLSTRIRTARNIVGIPMTCNMTKQDRADLESFMLKVFDKLQSDEVLAGKYYPLNEMTDEFAANLRNCGKLFTDDDETLKKCGTFSDWGEKGDHRGIYMNKSEEFLVWVGEEDQLRIMCMKMGDDMEGVWNTYAKGVVAIEAAVNELGKKFGFRNNLGYLSACPTNLGTGMRASVMITLPGVSKTDMNNFAKGKHDNNKEDLFVQVRNKGGESVKTDIGVYDISNRARLGMVQDQVKCWVNGLNKIVGEFSK